MLGEFELDDPGEAAKALLGAISQAAIGQILSTGQLDADATGDRLVPLLLQGVLAVSSEPDQTASW